MVERQTVADAGPSIVTDHRELSKTELFHYFDLVQSHRTLRIVDMIISIWWLAAVAVTAQIRNDECVALCQLGGDLTPLYMRLRVAVEKQDWWTVAANDHVNCRVAGLNRLASESWKEVDRATGYSLSKGGRALRGD